MSFEILSGIGSPKDLSALSETDLVQLSDEIREALLTIVSDRAATLPAILASSNSASRCI